MVMKKFKTIFASLALSLVFYSCRKEKNVKFEPKLPPETEGTVVIAGGYLNFEALEAEFDRFNEYYPNIYLSFEHLDDFNKTIRAAIKNTSAPDIYTTANWMLDKKEYDVLFEAAENLSEPSCGIKISAVQQELLYRHDGKKLLMVPVLSNTFGMLINENLFKKYNIAIPKTYEDLKTAAQTFKANGISTPILGYNNQKGMFYYFAFPYFCANIKTVPGSIPLLNSLSPEAGIFLKQALEYTQDLVKNKLINFEECNSMANEYNALIMRFFEGDIPILFSSADLVSGTKKRESQSGSFVKNPFEYSFHPIPIGEKETFFLNMPVIEFSVNKNSKNLKVANEFMRFLLTSPELNNLSKIKRLVTVSTDYSFDDMYSSFSAATPIYFDTIGIFDSVVLQVRSALWNVANGNMTIEEAMASYGNLPEE